MRLRTRILTYLRGIMSYPPSEAQQCNPTTIVYAAWMYIKNFSRYVYLGEKENQKFFGFSILLAAFNNYATELRRKAAKMV